jgi:hypothetical protein
MGCNLWGSSRPPYCDSSPRHTGDTRSSDWRNNYQQDRRRMPSHPSCSDMCPHRTDDIGRPRCCWRQCPVRMGSARRCRRHALVGACQVGRAGVAAHGTWQRCRRSSWTEGAAGTGLAIERTLHVLVRAPSTTRALPQRATQRLIRAHAASHARKAVVGSARVVAAIPHLDMAGGARRVVAWCCWTRIDGAAMRGVIRHAAERGRARCASALKRGDCEESVTILTVV